MSVQCVRGVELEKRKERGKTVGKPMDSRECAVVPMKSVKFPMSERLAQPPFESSMRPLTRDKRAEDL